MNGPRGGSDSNLPSKDRLLNWQHVAARLNISKSHFYRLKNQGQFVCLKIGGSLRVKESSVEHFIGRQINNFCLENGESVSGSLSKSQEILP